MHWRKSSLLCSAVLPNSENRKSCYATCCASPPPAALWPSRCQMLPGMELTLQCCSGALNCRAWVKTGLFEKKEQTHDKLLSANPHHPWIETFPWAATPVNQRERLPPACHRDKIQTFAITGCTGKDIGLRTENEQVKLADRERNSQGDFAVVYQIKWQASFLLTFSHHNPKMTQEIQPSWLDYFGGQSRSFHR